MEMKVSDLFLMLLGGVNLALVLKIIFNDLHEIRRLLVEHLRDHANK